MIASDIELLSSYPEFGPTLARWHYDQWGHNFPTTGPGSWTYEMAVEEFKDPVNVTWVAFRTGGSRTVDDILGSISLFQSDDLPGLEHLRPWIVSFFIREQHRGRGVGSALLETAVRFASTKYTDLYLWTEEKVGCVCVRCCCCVYSSTVGIRKCFTRIEAGEPSSSFTSTSSRRR